ncbi:MAG: nicotinate phosphoribosyltransferase [cyanobacterium endosymbiont of Rhopalodia sterrenbergii]
MLSQDQGLTVSPDDYSLLIDLYELTMVACYTGEKLAYRRASFELFIRHLPKSFGYLIAMGLAQGLNFLENLHFSQEQLEDLEKTRIFDHAPPEFWSILASEGFTGEVWAVPEGTAVFAHEPLLRIEAPLWQAQIVETYLLNTLNYQSLIATKAARIRDVAGKNSLLLESGTRRAFSPQGSVWAARAALAGGLDATSNVLAALKLGCKPSGTMAHSLIMAIKAISGNEDEAFYAFSRYFPGATLLLDTYDAVAAAERLAGKVNKGTLNVTGVRLDSGDLVTLSQKVRSLLPNIKIFASGDLDEWKIARLKEAHASIDGYGLGTNLVTGKPLNGVYKLVEIDGIPTMKQSSDKATYPGRKQIFRTYNEGIIKDDRLGLATVSIERAETPLLQLVMKEGKSLFQPESLETIRQRTQKSVESLPFATRHLSQPTSIEVKISNELESLRQSLG